MLLDDEAPIPPTLMWALWAGRTTGHVSRISGLIG